MALCKVSREYPVGEGLIVCYDDEGQIIYMISSQTSEIRVHIDPRLTLIYSDFMCHKWWFYGKVMLGEQSGLSTQGDLRLVKHIH